MCLKGACHGLIFEQRSRTMSSTNHFAKCLVFTLFLFLALRRTQATPVQCVVQAFGSGLSGKGISVTVRNSGFGCDGVFPWKPVTNSAKFDATGEAEVKLNLHASTFGVCMTDMLIKATFDYKCYAIERTVLSADWGNLAKHGSCRALEQRCGRQTSVTAVPYIDMWCRRPNTHVFNAGQPEEMRLHWRQNKPNDKC